MSKRSSATPPATAITTGSMSSLASVSSVTMALATMATPRTHALLKLVSSLHSLPVRSLDRTTHRSACGLT